MIPRYLHALINSSKRLKWFIAATAIGIPLAWFFYTLLLLGFGHSFLPESVRNLSRPTTFADFGQAFSAFEGLASSLALVLGLAAILLQVKYSHSQSRLSALSARLQFLVAEYGRLDSGIARIYGDKDIKSYPIARSMIIRRSRVLNELEETDEAVRHLLIQLGEGVDDYSDLELVLDATDEQAIKKNINKRVTVEGTVVDFKNGGAGHWGLLDFDGLSVIVAPEVCDQLQPLEEYSQRKIIVLGKLEMDGAKPEVRVLKANQIEDQDVVSVRSDDAEALESNLGRDVEAAGVVRKVNVSSNTNGCGFMDVDGLSVMILPSTLVRLKPLENYLEKKVKVIGELDRFKGRFQIKIMNTSQIKGV